MLKIKNEIFSQVEFMVAVKRMTTSRGLPIKTKLNLLKFRKLFNEHSELYEEVRKEKIETCKGTLNEDEGKYEFPNDGLERKFKEIHDELCEVEFEIDIKDKIEWHSKMDVNSDEMEILERFGILNIDYSSIEDKPKKSKKKK